MIREKSCGCIIFRDGKVLVEKQKSKTGSFWGFPKGHQEAGETDIKTALREVREEVGIEVEVVDVRPIRTEYLVHDGTVKKEVLLFVAIVKGDATIKMKESEVEDVMWLAVAEAENILTYESSKVALREANERLKLKNLG